MQMDRFNKINRIRITYILDKPVMKFKIELQWSPQEG